MTTAPASLTSQAGLDTAAELAAQLRVDSIRGATLNAAVAATSGRMVIAEDHRPEGGLASAVTDSLLAAARKLIDLAN